MTKATETPFSIREFHDYFAYIIERSAKCLAKVGLAHEAVAALERGIASTKADVAA